MNRKASPSRKQGKSGADVRHVIGIVAFGLFALVIVLMVLFPQLRPTKDDGSSLVGEDKRTRLLVLAASSLTDPLSEAAAAYEQAHPEWFLELSFAASNTLQRQVERGAPADLFLSAASGPVDALVEGGWVLPERRYALWSVELALIAPAEASNAAQGRDGADAGAKQSAGNRADTFRESLLGARRIAIGDQGVPVGEYAREALAALGLRAELDDRLIPLPNELAVVQAVATGACDQGIVYRSSAIHGADAGRIRELALFPADSYEPVVYHAAILASSPNPEGAVAFLDYLSTGEGATLFEAAGFHPPVHRMHGP